MGGEIANAGTVTFNTYPCQPLMGGRLEPVLTSPKVLSKDTDEPKTDLLPTLDNPTIRPYNQNK